MSSQLRDLSWSRVKIKAPISASPSCGRVPENQAGCRAPVGRAGRRSQTTPACPLPARGFWGVAGTSLVQASREFPIKASACMKPFLCKAILGARFLVVLDLSNYLFAQKRRKWSTKRP